MMTPPIWKRRSLDCRPLLTYAIDRTTRGPQGHRPDRMNPKKPHTSPVPLDLSHHRLLIRPAPACAGGSGCKAGQDQCRYSPVGFQNSAIGPELGFMRLARIR
jgi:hypothetical protein